MSASSTPPTPSTRNSERGFTLLELLIAAVVSTIVAGVVLPVVLSGRQVYALDQNRTSVNQSLRGALDLLGADVRQAAEMLPGNFPAIVVIDGGDGPDELILRRNLLDEVLAVCKDVNGSVIFIADPGAKPRPECAPQDKDSNGWPRNIGAWRNYRLGVLGKVLTAFVYDPVGRRGYFVRYDGEDSSGLKLHFTGGGWPANDRPGVGWRVYVLEERRYRLDPSQGLLQLIVDGDQASPRNLAAGVTGMRLSVLMADGTTRDALGAGDGWKGLRALDVSLEGAGEGRGPRLERSLAARFFPRNALSQ